MITPFVIRAFERLAAVGGAMEVLEEVAEGGSPTPAKVNRLLDSVSSDPEIGDLYQKALDDRGGHMWESLRDAVEDILRNVHEGVGRAHEAFSRNDVEGLLSYLRSVLADAVAGVDRGTMSRGLAADLGDMARRADEGDPGVWEGVRKWIEQKFPKPLASLTKWYMASYPVGQDKPKGALLSREHGADAGRIARDTVLNIFFEVVRSKIQDRSFEWKYDSDMHIYNTIVANARWMVRNRDTGDAWDVDKPTQTRGQRNWARYVAPLRGTEMFPPGDRPDLDAIADWLNENFRRDEPETVTAQIPGGGGEMTAKSFKRPKTSKELLTWLQESAAPQSLDVEMGEDGGTLGETLTAPEQQEDEEKRVEHLNAPDESDKPRREVARGKLKEMLHEAVESLPASYGLKIDAGGGVPGSLRDVVELIMLVKLGLASGSERSDFKKMVEGMSKPAADSGAAPKIVRMPFRVVGFNEDEWRRQGKPDRNKRTKSTKKRPVVDPPGVLEYTHDFDQRALVWKEGSPNAGEPFTGSMPSLLKNKDNLKVATVRHKAGDPVDLRDFREWSRYTEEDWEKDLDFALEVYDGQKWFQHSIDPAFRERLKKKQNNLAEVFEGFDPMKMWVPASKGTDQPLLRAMGQVMPSVATTSNSLFPNYSGVSVPLRNVMRRLGEMLKEQAEQGNYLPLEYLSLKGSGAIASARPELPKPSMERVVRSVVDHLMRCADAG